LCRVWSRWEGSRRSAGRGRCEQARELASSPAGFPGSKHTPMAAQVVFQHPPGALSITDQVETGHMAPAPERRLEAPHCGRQPMGASRHPLCGDDPRPVEDGLVGRRTRARKDRSLSKALDRPRSRRLQFAGADQAGRGSKGRMRLAPSSPEALEPERLPRSRFEQSRRAATWFAVDLLRCELAQGGEQGFECGPGSGRCGEVLVISPCVADTSVKHRSALGKM